jgi:hypothetical protein
MFADPVLFGRLLLNNRRVWMPCVILLGLCTIMIVFHQSDQHDEHIEIKSHSSVFSLNSVLTYEQVKILLDQLFDRTIPMVNIQAIWNQLMNVWREILTKFIHDACESCHNNDSYCYESIDIVRYIHYINASFYPLNETKRPLGMGVFYYFDLRILRSVNNSILPTDVTHCDYFHMMQLMINVQLVLHQAQIKYFLTKGTLIGVLRHHDVIPWDTDIDLFIPSSATSKILKSFRQLDPTVKQMATTESSTIRASKE